MKTYTTPKSRLISNFVVSFIAFTAIAAIVYLVIYESIHGDFTGNFNSPLAWVLPIPIAALCVYLSFFRADITVEVDSDGGAVRFLRRGKVFREFAASEFAFTSYVVGHSYNFVPIGCDRFLRVIDKSNGKHKDCKCNFLSKSAFEEMIAYADALSFAQYSQEFPQEQVKYAIDENSPLEFVINRELLIKQRNKNFLGVIALVFVGISFAIGYMWLSAELDSITASVLTAFLIVALLLIVLLRGVREKKYRRSIPENIRLSSDSITVDDRKFYFTYINQIRATPPSYADSKEDIAKIVRKLTIVERSETFVYIVGHASDFTAKEPAFDEYNMLCGELSAIFVNEPTKFVYDLFSLK